MLVIAVLVNVSGAVPSAIAARADEITHPALVGIHVTPELIELSTARDRQGIVVQAEYSDGSTRDVTSLASTQVVGEVATVAAGVVAPQSDGSGTLKVKYSGAEALVPVEVKRASVVDPLRFRSDVLPVFTKSGCNTGKCHGSASGKDGFRLSLFGYDPEGDQFRLTREVVGRRVNLASPEDCLLVSKSIGAVTHTGGQRIAPGSEGHNIILAWLRAGAPIDPAGSPAPIAIEVFPREAVFASPADAQRLVVRARFSDNTDRDVTRFAVFLTTNEAVATVEEEGVAVGKSRGESFILARYDKFTAGVPIIVRPGTPFESPKTKAFNWIDSLVHAKLDRLHVLPSDVCDDETFLRRAFIDLIGRLPSPVEREQFLADSRNEKRVLLADDLMKRAEFLDMWIMKWAELLQIRTTNGLSPKGLERYDSWLRDRIHSGVTIDRIAAELLAASGGSFDNPAVTYFQTETTPQLIAENVAQVFLGTRIQCAQCHNHPFDRWTLEDYYGFSAFFSRIGYKQAQDPRELMVFAADSGEMKHPVPGRVVRATFLGGSAPDLRPDEDYRKTLAAWLTSPENRAFTRNLANIVWAHFFGQGIIEPVDDARVSNPPSNSPLLEALAERLKSAKYDLKPLIRDVVQSRTYQLSTQRSAFNRFDERNFAHQKIRRMRAEVLLDCISQVTETSDRLPGLPRGGRAVQIPDGRSPNYFLTTFGRSNRESACSCAVKTTPTLSQALHLINGETTSGKIAEGKVVTKLLEITGDPVAVAGALYLHCLSRRPTPVESGQIASRLTSAPDKVKSLEDLFWALLNSSEFLFNH
jgi:hypothetical protein